MNKEFDKINICFAIDDKYTEHCSVAIVSILKNSSSLFHFFILNSRLNIENKQKIERLKNIKNFNITFIEVKLNHFENCYLPPGSHFSLVNYYRLKIASLLPHLDKVIYLDSDIIANRDLRELWEISLEGYYVGACKAMTYESNSERLGLSTGAPYINSGVLVLNLKKIRKNRIEDKFFDCIKKNPKVIRNVDQDIINLVLLEASDGIKQLRQNWNTEIRTDIPFEKVYLPIISEPYIIHFITGDKPWNPDSKQLYKEKYWEYHKEILMAERWSRESFIIKEYFNDDRTVRQGPFRGMNYSVGKSICSALLPKIYGSYEEPIQKWIQEIINNKYENIINIGCAEGYYAIGLALTSPNSKVYAYDTDAEALLLCKELARSNNVESKIIINDLCTHKELEYFGSKKTIVICDIEGDELHLLDPSLAEGLQYTDIIIEAHDFIADGISETLSDRFKHTHKIEMIVDYEREPKMVLGENINEEILREIIDEKRSVGMKWLRMISLKKYQKQSICSNNYAQESNKYVTQMINKCVKNKNNNKKGVVYTCITGGYDALVKHTFVDHNWDYVCFTDDLSIGNIDNYSWQIRPLRFDKLDNTRNQRWHKIHPHILFPEYEKSIWLDANINILNEDVFADIDKAIDESCLISIAPHPERNCIYDELIVCAVLGKDDEGVMRKQVDLMRSAGFPEKNGLFETNIMYRDHHNYQVIEIMNDWWWWIENYSRRDQLSLSYVLWQHKLKVKPLADISYRYSGGIEFINNTSHVTKEELIVQRDQLQQVLNLRDSKIVDFNQKMQTLTEQLEKRDSVVAERDAQITSLSAERAHILSSTSWKITRPLRFIRSNFINNPYFLFRKLISDSVRKIWITLPLSAHRKISLKNKAFKYLPFLFRWTKAYRDWVAMTGNAKIPDSDKYHSWILKNEPDQNELNRQKQESAEFKYRPKISIIMPTWNTDEKWLTRAIESVLNQTYSNWELCIADGGSTKKTTKSTLKQFAENDTRIKVRFLDKNLGISGNSNEALALATGEFIALLDHDDELAPFAFYEVIKLLNLHQEIDFIYSDEDKLDINGERCDAFFKPDWSLDLLHSCMYTCHLSVYRKSIIEKIGGFRLGYEGSQDYDLALRFIEYTSPDKIAHIPKILYHWRKVPGSIASNPIAKNCVNIVSGKKALADLLERQKIDGMVEDGKWLSSYRLRRSIIGCPKVSIIIPTRDHVELLKKCIDSIKNLSTYKNYEIIIVNNNSEKQETIEYIKSLDCLRIDYNDEFNFSKINNLAVRKASGEYLIFLNNDVEIITGDWIESLLENAQRKEVGAVGCKLLYPDRTIQHAGVILGLSLDPRNKVAGHIFIMRNNVDHGYFGIVDTIRNYSAVTTAAMMVRKEVFEEVGGFDECLKISYNDVDLCLKMRKKNYLIVYTPFVELLHYESASRGHYLNELEVNYMMDKWGSLLQNDPYYNPNLSLKKVNCEINV